MSCGLPFIATKLGGNIEAAGDTGILVPPGDIDAMTNAMIDLSIHETKRIKIGLNARKRIEKLFCDKIAYNKINSLLNKYNL